jgi:hypothetical protein
MSSSNLRLRNFVFTINNYSETDVSTLKLLKCNYIVFGYEVGESGTPHLQGYCELPNALSFKSLKKKLPRAHIERRMGTSLQASEYCKKDGNFYESGEISTQGKRTDIDKLVELVDDGNTNKQIASTEPAGYFKFHKHINAYRCAMLEPRCTKPNVIVYYGSTGTGKTARAKLNLRDTDYYTWGPEKLKWWDGYTGQKHVLMEEFRGQLPFGYMLRLLDRYEMSVEYKGGICEFVATTIILTSPKHPRDWYTTLYDNDRIDQLLRRIDTIKLCQGTYSGPFFDTEVFDTEVEG